MHSLKLPSSLGAIVIGDAKGDVDGRITRESSMACSSFCSHTLLSLDMGYGFLRTTVLSDSSKGTSYPTSAGGQLTRHSSSGYIALTSPEVLGILGVFCVLPTAATQPSTTTLSVQETFSRIAFMCGRESRKS